MDEVKEEIGQFMGLSDSVKCLILFESRLMLREQRRECK